MGTVPGHDRAGRALPPRHFQARELDDRDGHGIDLSAQPQTEAVYAPASSGHEPTSVTPAPLVRSRWTGVTAIRPSAMAWKSVSGSSW
jgi:hypothetical protein